MNKGERKELDFASLLAIFGERCIKESQLDPKGHECTIATVARNEVHDEVIERYLSLEAQNTSLRQRIAELEATVEQQKQEITEKVMCADRWERTARALTAI